MARLRVFSTAAWMTTRLSFQVVNAWSTYARTASVIPYVTDQLAMARMSRSTYALMVALLPAVATVIGVVVLAQLPSAVEAVGVALVIAGVAVHRDADAG